MTPASTAICSILVIVEIIFVPVYLKKMWPIKNWGSLGIKMICATAYVLLALNIAVNTGGFTGYSSLMMAGFVFSWLGDLMLHIPLPTKIYFMIGTAFFATAHVFYCLAYINAQKALFPEVKTFFWWEFALCAAIVAAYFIACFIRKVPFGIFLVPMLVYGCFVTMMMIKSTGLAVRLLYAQGTQALAPALLLLFGGFLFIQSDGSLALISVDTRYKKFKLKVYNIVTYFAAQVCLAFTILFIR